MFKERYSDELDRFAVSEDFKIKTIALLQQKQQECCDTHNSFSSQTTAFAKKAPVKYAVVCACIAVFLLSAAAIKLYNGNSAFPSDNQLYFTISDAQALTETTSPEFVVQAQYDNGSGFGYEGVLLKDIDQYDNGNPFSVYDSFDTLPVYNFNALTVDQAEKETYDILKAVNADYDAAEKQITLTELIYTDGHLSSHNDVTFSSEKFARIELVETLIPYRYETQFDGGDIQIWLPRGETRLTLDTDTMPDGTPLTEYIGTHFSATLGYDNSVVCTDTDYNIYGEENPTYYIYSRSEDYAQNIFNYSVNNARVYYLTKEESLEENDQFIFWKKNNCFTRGKEMPAINWQQALGLLYNGDYYSSVPYEITDETVVNRIELVYKDAPYDSMTLTSSGVCLPFYKFYVNIEEMDIPEKDLEDYGIYYVCAINPAYIEITDNYAQFN